VADGDMAVGSFWEPALQLLAGYALPSRLRVELLLETKRSLPRERSFMQKNHCPAVVFSF
jgi:hypothetical protein